MIIQQHNSALEKSQLIEIISLELMKMISNKKLLPILVRGQEAEDKQGKWSKHLMKMSLIENLKGWWNLMMIARWLVLSQLKESDNTEYFVISLIELLIIPNALIH